MPVFRADEKKIPDWCEIDFFEIIQVKSGEKYMFKRKSIIEKLFLGEGKGIVSYQNKSQIVKKGDHLELKPNDEQTLIRSVNNSLIVIRIGGHWGDNTGDSGVFTLKSSLSPMNIGDAVNYPRNTIFDNHYHDCDEYWIIFKGRGLIVTEGIFHEIGPGDCVATKMGDHHDFPQVYETIHGVYFETTLKDKKRIGHLWNHTQGTMNF